MNTNLLELLLALFRLVSEKKQRGHLTLRGMALFAVSITTTITHSYPHISSYLTT